MYTVLVSSQHEIRCKRYFAKILVGRDKDLPLITKYKEVITNNIEKTSRKSPKPPLN